MAPKYEQTDIDTLRKALVDAPVQERPRRFSTREAVHVLADELRELIENRGYTIASLAKFMSEKGVKVGAATLSQYARDEGVIASRERQAKGARRRSRKSAEPRAPSDTTKRGGVDSAGSETDSMRQGSGDRPSKGRFKTLNVPEDL